MSTITWPARRTATADKWAHQSADTLLLDIHLPRRDPVNHGSVALLAGLLTFSVACWSAVVGLLLTLVQ